MKKIIIVLFFIVVISIFIKEKDNILIPKDSIRFRVIANSNSNLDQKTKKNIKNNVEKYIYTLVGKENNMNTIRKIINDNIDNIKDIIDKYNVDYNISFGNNYFPTKEYKGIIYKEGIYDSLVITLGNGIGNNWWCVLFPPLCLLDEEKDNIHYEYYVNKIINDFKKLS